MAVSYTSDDMRALLRGQLSNYSAGSLIPNTSPNDQELQFINEAIDQVWPYDFYQAYDSIGIVAGQSRYFLANPSIRHIFEVSASDADHNSQNYKIMVPIPAREGWIFGERNIGGFVGVGIVQQKVLTIRDLSYIGQCSSSTQTAPYNFLVYLAAEPLPHIAASGDLITVDNNDTIQAVIHMAAARYFTSQYQVNTESIRYRNYVQFSQTEQSLGQALLLRNPKTLYMV